MNERKTRYGIIGSGALGGLYGAMLARAGFEVHFLLNSDFDHVQQHGMKIESVWGNFHLAEPHIHASADDMPPCDVTIVGLKTTNNHLLPSLLPAPTSENGVVLVLQNGLGVEADSAAVVGSERVLGGCCFLCSNKVGPGHIKHIDYGRIVFGKYKPAQHTPNSDGSSNDEPASARQIATDMTSAGIDANVTENLLRTRWQKLMWNIPFNGLSVALNASTSDLINNPKTYRLCESIIREVHSAAAACGADVPADMIEKTLEHTVTMVPYDSSMRLDFLARRPIEIEAILGSPIRAAKHQGFEMPRVEMLYQQLEFLDMANRTA